VRKLYAGDVSKENAMAMERALGFPRRAGSVDDEGGILARGINRCKVRGGALECCPETDRGAILRLHDEDVRKLREGGCDRLDLRRIFSIGDQGFCSAIAEAMFERLRAELREQRHGDRAHLVDGDVRKSGFRTLRQQNAHPIAALNAMRAKHIGEPIG